MRLFTLFTYLKTKESYDRWVTRRVWGFRHQISKAKYLKMSVGNIRKLQENTAAVHVWLGRRYQRIRICLTGEVETPSSPIRRQVPDAKYPDGMSVEKNSGCETSGWNVGGAEFWMWDIRVECRRSRIPDVLSGSLTKVHKPCYVIPTACHNPRFTALRWCVWTPCPDIFCHGFQRTLLNLRLLWW